MNGTPIGLALRFWFLAELFFAAAATLAVALDPAKTSTNFAWTIKPVVMASLIGAFYVALAPVMVLAIFARRWEMVRVFVIPGALFTLTELIVTFLHWERFAVGSGPFNLWFASYLLPPPVFLACYLWQEKQARRATGMHDEGHELARWQRFTLFALGSLLTLETVIALIWPAWLTASAPWAMSALNARALAGYLGLLGMLMLSMAHENHRDRVRLVSPFLVLLLPVIAFQVCRFSDQVDWNHPRIFVTVALLAVVAGLGLSLMRGSWRRTLT